MNRIRPLIRKFSTCTCTVKKNEEIPIKALYIMVSGILGGVLVGSDVYSAIDNQMSKDIKYTGFKPSYFDHKPISNAMLVLFSGCVGAVSGPFIGVPYYLYKLVDENTKN